MDSGQKWHHVSHPVQVIARRQLKKKYLQITDFLYETEVNEVIVAHDYQSFLEYGQNSVVWIFKIRSCHSE